MSPRGPKRGPLQDLVQTQPRPRPRPLLEPRGDIPPSGPPKFVSRSRVWYYERVAPHCLSHDLFKVKHVGPSVRVWAGVDTPFQSLGCGRLPGCAPGVLGGWLCLGKPTPTPSAARVVPVCGALRLQLCTHCGQLLPCPRQVSVGDLHHGGWCALVNAAFR